MTFSQWIDSFTIIKQFSLSLWLEAYIGDQSWVFFGRTDAKAETPILWPPHVKSWLIGKDCDAGRDWRQEEKVMTEDDMAGWHHPLGGHEFEWTPGVSDGQGGLVCCDSWGHKESDMTEQLNWTEYCYSRFLSFSIFIVCVLGKKERYKHLNAELQRIARRDMKAFLSDQCKEIEENNRMGKTRDLFKKIGDIKGTFHVRMGTIQDRKSKDLTGAKEIKKRWQEHTEELYKKRSSQPR